MWDGVETIRVYTNGINFEVASRGEGDRLALCLHGFPEHAYSWRHQIPLLAKLGYRVWAPNLRGYGGTDSPRDVSEYKIETLVDDVAGLIRGSGAREILLIAHDWGGALAWLLAMRRPELIQRLVVCNLPHPACFFREVKRPPQMFMSWYMLFFRLPWLPDLIVRRRAAEMILRSCRDRSRFPQEALETYRHNAMRPGGSTAMLNWYRALSFRQAHGPFPKIDIPTLLIWGEEDVALSIRTIDGTDEYVSNLTIRRLPGVSHWVQQEAPEKVNAILEEWVPM